MFSLANSHCSVSSCHDIKASPTNSIVSTVLYSKSTSLHHYKTYFLGNLCLHLKVLSAADTHMPYRTESALPLEYRAVQFSSFAQLCPNLCDPMNRSTPGLPVHHQLPEFTQTHIHRVSDAIQPSHPLSSPSPPALNPSQHQSLFQ